MKKGLVKAILGTMVIVLVTIFLINRIPAVKSLVGGGA